MQKIFIETNWTKLAKEKFEKCTFYIKVVKKKKQTIFSFIYVFICYI